MKSIETKSIDAAKKALPLPKLLLKLGFPLPAEGEELMRCPFAPSYRSFSISKREGKWQWTDSRGKQNLSGDEIALLMRLEGLQRSAAIFRYLDLAGVENEAARTRGARVPTSGGEPKTGKTESDDGRPGDQVEKLKRMARDRGFMPGSSPGGNGNGKSDPPAFDPRAALDELGMYWLNGSQSFFMRREENGRPWFAEMGAGDVKRKLRVRGFRPRPDADAGENVSQIDRILDEATESRVVDFAGNIAGTRAGVYEQEGKRLLVKESPRLIEPQDLPDGFPVIEEFLRALLGDGSIHFASWLKIAYEALRADERRPGQVLILVGPPDCGKSRVQHQLITPILGGRSADPKSYFGGLTDFNAELISVEHLLVEEMPSSSRHDDRQYLGERIKEIAANDKARLHKKGSDAITVSPFWRISMSINDNPEKLRCLPPITDDLADKIIMLMVKPAHEFWARFAGEMDPRRAFREAIERELPAFAHFLLTMPIPERLKGRRYGVQSFIPEEIAQLIFEGEAEHHLLLMIDKEIFKENRLEVGDWIGDAEDLKQALCADGSSVKSSASKALIYPSVCGQLLARLAVRMPGRFSRARTATKRSWIIRPPK